MPMHEVQTVIDSLIGSQIFKIAWRVYECLGGTWPSSHRTPKDYVTFFRILKSEQTPSIIACLMHGLLDDMRIEAFRTIQTTTLGEKVLPAPEAYAVDKFVDILGFDDTAEALDWCEFYSIEVLEAEDYVKKVQPNLEGFVPKLGQKWDQFVAKALAKEQVIAVGKTRGVVKPGYEEVCSRKENNEAVVEPHTCKIIDAKQEGITAWELISVGTGIVIDEKTQKELDARDEIQRKAREIALASKRRREEIEAKKIEDAHQLDIIQKQEEDEKRRIQTQKDRQVQAKAREAQRIQDQAAQQQRLKVQEAQRIQDEAAHQQRLKDQAEAARKAKAIADQKRIEEEERQRIIAAQQKAEREARALAEQRRQAELRRIQEEQQRIAEARRKKEEEERQAEQKRTQESVGRRLARHDRLKGASTVNRSTAAEPDNKHETVVLFGQTKEPSKRARMEVVQSVSTVLDVADHLIDRNPKSEELFWRFVVFGQARSEPFSALEWVCTRMQRIPCRLPDATTSSARVLADYTAQIAKGQQTADRGTGTQGLYPRDNRQRHKELRVRGSQVRAILGVSCLFISVFVGFCCSWCRPGRT